MEMPQSSPTPLPMHSLTPLLRVMVTDSLMLSAVVAVLGRPGLIVRDSIINPDPLIAAGMIRHQNNRGQVVKDTHQK